MQLMVLNIYFYILSPKVDFSQTGVSFNSLSRTMDKIFPHSFTNRPIEKCRFEFLIVIEGLNTM